MTMREIGYAELVALGVIIPMYYNLQYLAVGGNLLVDFFTVPLQSAVTAYVATSVSGEGIQEHGTAADARPGKVIRGNERPLRSERSRG